MPSARDTGRASVYRSENIISEILDSGGTIEMFGATFTLPESGQRRFGRVEDIQRYLDALWQMSWVREYNVPQPRLRVRRGDRMAHYRRKDHTISIPQADWALTEMVVLHESAHALCDQGGHGQRFRHIYADLASRAIDPVVGIMLNHHFDMELAG